MGEAARRKKLGFDGRKLGETVLAALNEDMGGIVWGIAKTSGIAPLFLVLDAETTDTHPGMITHEIARTTPHRVVGVVLERRGEAWLEVIVFDPSEEYRGEFYQRLQERALRIAAAHGVEDLDGAWHEIVSSTWAPDKDRQVRVLQPPPPAS
jgi:hypothetical protein